MNADRNAGPHLHTGLSYLGILVTSCQVARLLLPHDPVKPAVLSEARSLLCVSPSPFASSWQQVDFYLPDLEKTKAVWKGTASPVTTATDSEVSTPG